MPFYEYLCPDCETRFEALRSIAQRDSPVPCPECKGTKCDRLIALPLAYSRLEDGSMRVIGGSPCNSCVAATCSGCTVR